MRSLYYRPNVTKHSPQAEPCVLSVLPATASWIGVACQPCSKQGLRPGSLPASLQQAPSSEPRSRRWAAPGFKGGCAAGLWTTALTLPGLPRPCPGLCKPVFQRWHGREGLEAPRPQPSLTLLSPCSPASWTGAFCLSFMHRLHLSSLLRCHLFLRVLSSANSALDGLFLSDLLLCQGFPYCPQLGLPHFCFPSQSLLRGFRPSILWPDTPPTHRIQHTQTRPNILPLQTYSFPGWGVVPQPPLGRATWRSVVQCPWGCPARCEHPSLLHSSSGLISWGWPDFWLASLLLDMPPHGPLSSSPPGCSF